MNGFRGLIAAAAFAALPAGAGAAAGIDAWELISPAQFDWRERPHRRAIAEDLLVRLNLLADVIPPLSPQQEAQVANEMADLQRMDPGADTR
ncbi:MAG: hypothetical protein OXG51_04510, partial [Gammaproteobacteria bacterium]|nr:hypothetical protein [Gammaproteobacteria bacterium]